MTAGTVGVAGTGPDGSASGPAGPPRRPPGPLRRRRMPLLVGGLLLAVALLSALLIPRGTREALDPKSPTPDGSRAVAQILQREGVQVTRATRMAELTGRIGAGSTLLVTRTELLSPERLQQLADSGADLVLVEPDGITLSALAPSVQPAGETDGRVGEPGPQCRSDDALAAGRADAGGLLFRVQNPTDPTDPTDPAAPADPADPADPTLAGSATALTVCYPDPDDARAGSYVTGRVAGRRVTVIGQAEVLTNGYLARQGNAALALRSLGDNGLLLWYLPDPLDGGAVQPGLDELRPPWVRWAAWQLALAALVAILWQARRLGRLVKEPLPVLVRASETQEGRARLYRAYRARGRAAATLRTASIRRLARRLDAPAEATPAGVVRLVAAASGRTESDVAGLLLGPAPADDAALVWLADQLDQLEAAVADPTGRPRGGPSNRTSREVPRP